MYYYKRGNTYVATPTQDSDATEISKAEYDAVLAIINNRPSAPDGFGYRLNGLEWELYQLPDESEAELTAQEALEIVLGGAV